MTIEFQCDGCRKRLRTSDDKAGRTARCPQCGSVVAIPSRGGAFEEIKQDRVPPYTDFEEFSPETSLDRPRAVVAACPMCGAMNDEASDRCHRCGEILSPTTTSRSTSFSDVWQRAWSIWTANLGINIVAALLCGIAFAALWLGDAMVAGFAMAMIEETIGPDPAIEAVVMSIYFVVLVVCYWPVSICFCHFAMANVRRAKPTIGDLAPPWPLLTRAMVGMLCYGLVSALLFAPGVAFMAGGIFVDEQGGNEGLAALLLLAGFAFFMVATFCFALYLWPIPYMLADGKGIGESLMGGLRMTNRFLGLSFLLVLANMLIGMAGSLLCCIAPLFTYPLAAILFAVAYEHGRLAMQQQRVEKPGTLLSDGIGQ